MASVLSTGAAAAPPPRPLQPPPPPQPPKESFVRRYRFLWPLLLVVNFTIGAYVLMRTTTKSKSTSEEEIPVGPTTSTSTSTAAASTIIEKPITANPITENLITPPIMKPVVRAPIPEDQQHELFKWMLEEKRKVKPRDAEEKKRIDEEKYILKQFIQQSKFIPSL
ncbi:hypothetical protein CASFOL_024972 [Castilleja foliolosa]|uniref:Uncharacterized protein n=1 Tax=Castilleja foliolosa TaxID=1961234 RepID=A0ABD3CPU3_9LAMI